MVVPLFVGRDKSIAALEAALSFDRLIFLSSQTDPSTNDPVEDEIHQIGTVSHIIQMLRLPDSTVKVLVEGSPCAGGSSITFPTTGTSR